MDKKKILVLGGNTASCDIVKKAQEMGMYVIVTDWYDIKRSPAKSIADKSYNISISDIDELTKIIEDENINGVITGFTDSYLPYYYELCQKTGLHCYGTLEQFELCTNKIKFKETCRKYGVPIAKEYTMNDINSIEYPVIVKPADNSGSRGVFRCNNKEELIDKYNEALAFSNNKNVIIERCIQGKHVNMYYTLADGEIYLSAMADRNVFYPNQNIAPLPLGLIHPSNHLDEYIKNVDGKIKNMFKELGMRNGIVFVQGFYDAGEFVIYEMGYRLNGGSTFFLIDKCSKYNQLEMLINYAVYGDMLKGYDNIKVENPTFNDKIAVNYVISLKKGIISKIKGIETIEQVSVVEKILQMHHEGDNLNSEGTTSQIFAYILIVANNMEELKNTLEIVNNNLIVLDENGNNMINAKFNI